MKKSPFRALLLLALSLVSTPLASALVYFPPEEMRDDHELRQEVVLASEDIQHAESDLQWDTSECGEIPFNVDDMSKMKFEALHHFHCDVAPEVELANEEADEDLNKILVPKNDVDVESNETPSFNMVYFPPLDERDEHTLEPTGSELIEEIELAQEEEAANAPTWQTYTCDDFAAMTYDANDIRMNALYIFHCELDEVITHEGDPDSLYEVADNDVEMDVEMAEEDDETEESMEDTYETEDEESEDADNSTDEEEEEDSLLIDLSELFEE